MIEIINIGGLSMYLSYSRINTFNNCSKQYKFQYLDNIPIENKNIAEVTSLGILYHKIFAELTGGLDENQVREICHRVVGEENITYETMKQMEEVVVNWYNPFDFDNVFAKEHKIQFTLMSHIFTGYLDRIDKFDDKAYEIIDYKTGNYEYRDYDLKNSLQFDIYSFALFTIYKPDVIRMTYDNVQMKTKVHAQTTIDELPIIRNRLATFIRRIENATSFPATLGNHCLYCPFKDKCEEFKNDKYEFNDVVKTYVKSKVKGKFYKEQEQTYYALLLEQMQEQDIEEISYGSYSIKLLNGKIYLNKAK